MTPARLRWGLLFILIGTLLLLVQLDVIYSDFWWDLIGLIPYLLIAIGIEKIFAHTRLKIISYLAPIVLVAGTLWVVIDRSSYGDSDSYFRSSTIKYDPSEEIDSIHAILELDNSHLTIRDAAPEVFYARFGEYSYKPSQTTAIVDGLASIKLSARGQTRRFWGGTVVIEDDEDDWRVSFSRHIPLNLECYGEENDIHLNMATTPLEKLKVEADDASVYIKLGDLIPRVGVSLQGYDSRIRLRVPREAGLRVTGFDDADAMAEAGLIEDGEAYVSEGYADAEPRIDVELSSGQRDLTIDFY